MEYSIAMKINEKLHASNIGDYQCAIVNEEKPDTNSYYAIPLCGILK